MSGEESESLYEGIVEVWKVGTRNANAALAAGWILLEVGYEAESAFHRQRGADERRPEAYTRRSMVYVLGRRRGSGALTLDELQDYIASKRAAQVGERVHGDLPEAQATSRADLPDTEGLAVPVEAVE